jgi:hypothetical protein
MTTKRAFLKASSMLGLATIAGADRVEAHQRGEQPPSASVSRPPAR